MRARFVLACSLVALLACPRKTKVASDPAPQSTSSVPPLTSIPADATIRLERSNCMGGCPAYAVTIHADGRVDFEMRNHYSPDDGHPGPPDAGNATIETSAVLGLVHRIREVGFFDMADEYPAHITDTRGRVVTVTLDGRTKTIRDEGFVAPNSADPPKTLRDLEDEIDRVAGTRRWVGDDD